MSDNTGSSKIDYLTLTANDLERDEGFRARVYDDATGATPYKTWKGFLTVGFGTNVEAGISRRVARAMLLESLRELEADFLAKCPWYHALSSNRKRAILNLAYNMGLVGLLGFRNMIRALDEKRYRDAAEQLVWKDPKAVPPVRTKYFTQVGEARAMRVHALIVDDA